MPTNFFAVNQWLSCLFSLGPGLFQSNFSFSFLAFLNIILFPFNTHFNVNYQLALRAEFPFYFILSGFSLPLSVCMFVSLYLPHCLSPTSISVSLLLFVSVSHSLSLHFTRSFSASPNFSLFLYFLNFPLSVYFCVCVNVARNTQKVIEEKHATLLGKT